MKIMDKEKKNDIGNENDLFKSEFRINKIDRIADRNRTQLLDFMDLSFKEILEQIINWNY